MLKQTSNEFREFFLLQLTEELIKNSGGDIFRLENILDQEDKIENILDQEDKIIHRDLKKRVDIKEKVKQIIKVKQKKPMTREIRMPLSLRPLPSRPLSKPMVRKPMAREINRPISPRPPFKQIIRRPLRPLNIPEPQLPLNLQYLKPTPGEKQIEIEKLNALINDPMVRIIECHGPGEHIMVRGTMGTKRTNITLNKDEINKVIQRFSEKARIPIQEGVFRVVVGKLILLAVVSNLISSKFIIKKMMYAPLPPSPSFLR